MSGPVRERGISRGAFIILVASVTGICLIAKVWIIRRGMGLEVDSTSLVIPGILAVAAEAADHLTRKKQPRFPWNHPVLWTAIIVIATVLSLIPYWKSSQ